FGASRTFLATWGSARASGEFANPSGVATDGNGNIYVADTGNSRIQKFDANGTFLTAWGDAAGFGVATDGNGNVYVAEGFRIQKFDAKGTYLTTWGREGSGNGQFNGPIGVATDAKGNVYVAEGDVYVDDTDNHRIQKFDANGTLLTAWGSKDSGDGQLQAPIGVATDGNGNVYVLDDERIKKFACP